MRVVIAGAHGKVARLLGDQLRSDGHTVTGLVRRADHLGELALPGVVPVLVDLEAASLDDVAEVLRGADAAVFAAGSGEASTVARSLSMDRDGAILFAQASARAGVRRFVMLSGAGADEYERGSTDPFQVYLRAKSDADAAVRTLDLDWVILRPDALHDGPGSRSFAAGTHVERKGIARADVAAALRDVAVGPDPGRLQLEITTGDRPLRAALAEATLPGREPPAP
ncbi:NAD(P)H-binding protein [Curtobacterium sp. A7_M15]|uniref:NAD(P)H-binding protein n=1 Tax=Curtobacterium sp. A7_M15 TaxID=3065241 RepID=UPI002737AC15|nr:NAD(P)H-binding protein [Curtobacterium sp. A7_M15]MDP4334561.1 NAD(P)H-binding protein [Curtobacterium sp. A7_M15]